jgi:hypothetical protein
MQKASIVRIASRAAIAALLAGAFMAGEAGPTFAGNCGGHCQQMKVCTSMVKQKGLKDGSARQAEWNKCMTDPQNYH